MLLHRYGVPTELYDVAARRILRTFERDNFAGTSPRLTYYGVSASDVTDGKFRLEIRELRTDRLVAAIAGTGPVRNVDLQFSADERHVYCRGLDWNTKSRPWTVFELPAGHP